ncbi:MAG: hypothetical protein ACR2H2_19185 [Solirubrobacteraceae bacterium]
MSLRAASTDALARALCGACTAAELDRPVDHVHRRYAGEQVPERRVHGVIRRLRRWLLRFYA